MPRSTSDWLSGVSFISGSTLPIMVGSSGGLCTAERVDSVCVQEPLSQPGQVYDESGTGVTDIGDRGGY